MKLTALTYLGFEINAVDPSLDLDLGAEALRGREARTSGLALVMDIILEAIQQQFHRPGQPINLFQPISN